MGILKYTRFVLPLVCYTEYKTGMFQFKKLMIASYFLGALVSCALKPNNVPGLKVHRFRLSCIVTVAFAVVYLLVEEGCRKPNAYDTGDCLLPNWFNHNAVMHCAFMASFYGVISSFTI